MVINCLYLVQYSVINIKRKFKQSYQKNSNQASSVPDWVFREGMYIANNLMNHTRVSPLCLSEVTHGSWSGAGSPTLHSVEVVND